MQIAFHIGAHCTDEDRLLKSLLKNTDALMQQGIAVPGPGRYRNLIRETLLSLAGATPDPDARDILLAAIVDTDDPRRLVMSSSNFICIPQRVVERGVFYPQAETKTRALHRLFPEDEISLFMGIRNPAAFLQQIMPLVKAQRLGDWLGLLTPEEIRWSDVVRRIRQGAPDTPLTIWCNEDSPLLWDQLIRRISGGAPQMQLQGSMDLLSSILSPAGLVALAENMIQTPPRSDAERHHMIADIWADHALPEVITDDIDLPELDTAMVAHMTALYEEDLEIIATMPGVELLLPFQ